MNPEYPFEYHFLDQDIDNMYKSEQRLGSLFNVFAVLAIVISCLGLYGLSAYLAERRTRELGIRKVLGAFRISIGIPIVCNLYSDQSLLQRSSQFRLHGME